MIKKNIFVSILFCSISIVSAQHQNYELKNIERETKTYIGRDFVRLLPGYKCSATDGQNLHVKVSSGLTTEEANDLLSETYNNGYWDIISNIDKNVDAGIIPIESSVSPSGAKAYNVPIDVISGRMGFQPSISLSYNSQDGNGVVGVGWNISGLSSINRVNRNLYYDGECGIVDLSSNDKFELNGERLIQLNKTSTQIEYETSTGNTFVTAYINGEVIKYFKVRFPSGIVGIFGFTDNTVSKIDYPVTKLTDATGNNINYTYIDDANTYYIDVIRYGGRGENGTTGYLADFAKVDFTYTDNRIDVISQYIVDKTVKMTKILDKIECYANSETIPEKIYNLSYSNTDDRIQNSPTAGMSTLTEIACVANGKELNSLKFICGENVSKIPIKTEKTFLGQSFDLKNVKVFNMKSKSSASSAFVKFPKIDYLSADGLSLTYPPSEKIEILEDFLKDSYSTKNIDVGSGFLGALTGNVDGYEGDEIIRINSGGMQRYNDAMGGYFCIEPLTVNVFTIGVNNMFSLTGSKSIYISYIQTMKMNKKDFLIGNFTGTGKDELIIFFSNTSTLFNLNNTPYTQVTIPIGKTSEEDKVLAVDIDGDTQTEVIVIRATKTDVYKYKTGVGFQDIADWALTTVEFNERQILFADLNQDGNIDIIKSPLQNTLNVEYETRKAPSWFKYLHVDDAFVECDCGYVQKKAYRFYDPPTAKWNIHCVPYIAVLKSDNREPQIISTEDTKSPYIGYINPKLGSVIYPRLTSNNMVQSFCPGCNEEVTYELKEYDGFHCWSCNNNLIRQYLIGGRLCCWGKHHSTIDKSDWKKKIPVKETPVKYSEWIYQYTNGKNIIQTETIKGITRENDYKFSIHEVDGDGIPDLLFQNDSGYVFICPYNTKTRSFAIGSKNIDKVPLSFELFDVNLEDDYKNSNLFALGSNKIINIKFPYNHTRNNMVSLMVNSLGVVDKTDYTLLTNSKHYTKGTQAQFPYSDFLGSMWVVSKNSQMADKKVTTSVSYNYANGISHDQGLDFLGFGLITSTDLMTNRVTLIESDPYKQGVITKYSSDTEEISVEYSYTVASNKKTTLLPIKKIITDKLKGNVINVTLPLAEYDSYGNAKKEVFEYSNGFKSTIIKQFENRIGTKNFIGLLMSKEITNERGGSVIVSGENYLYNGAGQLYNTQTYVKQKNVNDILEEKLISETTYDFDDTYKTLKSETTHNNLTNDYLTSTYTYWDDDKCSIRTITDPLGRVKEFSYDFIKRLITQSKDEYGKTTVYGYDNWRKLNKITQPDGTVTDISVTWDGGTNPDYLTKETTTTTGQPTTYKLTDAFGRVTRSSVAGFKSGTEILTDTEYDSFGRVHTTSIPYKLTESPLLTTYTYDKYNRVEKIQSYEGGVTSYYYSGNTVTTNTNGIVSSKTTDATGMLTSVTDAGGTVTYTYRADGQLDKINAAGVETVFEYKDAYNRQTKLVDPSAGTIETQYDDASRKVKQIWNSGKEITTEFDHYGQVFSKYTPDFTATYTYEKGKYKDVTYTDNSRAMSKSNTYDEFGRLWKVNELVEDKTLEQEYLYDLGKLSSVTYRANTGSNSLTYQVGYKYNSNGYMYKIVDENENLLREINSVNAFGQETSVSFGDGLTTQTAYTPNGVLTNINTSNNTQNISYDFDPINGTLNSRTDNKYGLSESFNYGVLYRLEGYGTTANRHSVGYNANGNIESKTDGGGYAYTLSGKPYTLSGINTTDNSGQKTQLDINYTVMSRPTTISNGTYTAYIDYNDAYERVYEEFKQGANTLSTKYLLAGGQYEVETKAGVETQRLYVDGSPYSASVIVEKIGSAAAQPYYLHRDYLGSITQVTDKFGNLVAEYSYDAWGRMRNVTNWQLYAAGTEPELRFGRGYTGHEHLNKLGVINMNARLYDPVLGRFLAPDPLVASPDESNGYNRYMYASNNPLMYVDIDGEQDGYPGRWTNPGGGWPSGGYGPYAPNYSLPGSGSSGGFSMGGGLNYNGGYSGGSGYGGGSYGGGYSYGASNNPLAFMFFLGDLFYTSKSERERFNVHVKSSPSVYTFKSTVRLKNVSGSGTSTVYAGGGKRQGGNNRKIAYRWESAPVQDYSGFWGTLSYIWNGGNVDGVQYNWDGEPIGITPIMGVAPDFIGGPLRKGEQALKLGKYLFNPSAFHNIKKVVIAFANPKSFSHIVGSNPDLLFKGGKIWLTGTKTGGYFGKSYETGMTISEFLKLF